MKKTSDNERGKTPDAEGQGCMHAEAATTFDNAVALLTRIGSEGFAGCVASLASSVCVAEQSLRMSVPTFPAAAAGGSSANSSGNSSAGSSSMIRVQSPVAKFFISRALATEPNGLHAFFARNGMISHLEPGCSIEKPVHSVACDLRSDQNILPLRTPVVKRGPPHMGAGRAPYADQAETSDFELGIIDLSSPYRLIEKPAINVNLFASIIFDERKYWSTALDNLFMFNLCGIGGFAEFWNGDDILQASRKKSASKAMQEERELYEELNKHNSIERPTRQFAAWQPDYGPCKKLNINNACKYDNSAQMFDKFAKCVNHMWAYMQTNYLDDDGIIMEKPKLSGCLPDQGMLDSWIWLVPPQIAGEMRRSAKSAKPNRFEAMFGGLTGYAVGGPDFVRNIRMFSFFECDCLPHYYGGADGKVRICRTVILGRNALCVYFRKEKPDPEASQIIAELGRGGADYSSPGEAVFAHEHGKLWFGSKISLGVRKVSYKGLNGSAIDKGVIAVDIPVCSE